MKNNPYVGPASIPENRNIYGRDREIGDLADLLIAERIVLLYSASGAGKSSLLQAGLLPAMRKRRFTARPFLRVNAAPPPGIGFDASTGNRYVLSCLLSLEEKVPVGQKRPVADLVRMTLADYLGEEGKGELLVFDQFEEILTVEPLDRAEKVEFFLQLGEALRGRGRWAIFAMREDYLAGLDPYLNYVPTRFSNTYRLGLLNHEAATEAIRQPAEALNVKFTKEAATELAANLRQINVHSDDGKVVSKAGEWVEPVQLQVVCFRLWEQLPDNATEIGVGHLATVGNVDAALGGYYSDSVALIAKRAGVSERDLRDWFDQELITKANTRGQVMQGSDESVAIAAALEPLVGAHLIRSDKRLGSIWYELAHDRLIAPVRANNREWRLRNLSLLQRQTELWLAQNRCKERLLSAVDLAQAQVWAAANPLRQEERVFLAESAEEQMRCKEIEQTELARRHGKRMRLFAGAATLFAFILAGALWRARHVLADANREAAHLLEEGQKEKARLILEAERQRDAMQLTVLREISIESMLDDRAAGGEVKALDPAWITLASGPEKLGFALAREAGKGRVIAVGHDGFLNYTNSAGSSLFLKTALQWLKRDRPGPIMIVVGENADDGNARILLPRLQKWGFDAQICNPPDHFPSAEVLGKASLVIVTHRLKPGAQDVQNAGKFVADGGGLLTTGYGWVWVKYDFYHGVDTFGPKAEVALESYPLNQLMRQFGVRWTNEIARANLK